jgi:hypothetical protein
MTDPIKPQQKSPNFQTTPLIIYRDDHRNTHEFLSKHPHTRVIDRDAPKKYKKPNNHHSVHRHHPRTTTIPTHSSTVTSPRMPAQRQTSLNNNDHDDANELESSSLDQAGNEDIDSGYDHEQENSFLFHEMASESHDPETDALIQVDSQRIASRPGTTESLDSIKSPIDNITIDPNSFILQTDAQDGSVTFKASLLFDVGDEYDDYDIIVTHITG